MWYQSTSNPDNQITKPCSALAKGYRALLSGLALGLCGLLPLSGQTEFFWTGGGTNDLWSNADNWLDGEIPSALGDLAHFGSEGPTEALNVTVDVAVEFGSVRINENTTQPVNFNASGPGAFNFAGQVSYFWVFEGVTQDVTVNVPVTLNVNNSTSVNWYPRNSSTEANLIFNAAHNTANRNIYMSNGKYAFNGPLLEVQNLQYSSAPDNPVDVTLNPTSFSTTRGMIFAVGNNAVTRFATDMTFVRGIGISSGYNDADEDGVRAYFQLVQGGSDDRIITLGRSMTSVVEDSALRFLENEAGSTGRFILRATGSGSNGTHTLPIVTRDNSYIQFDGTGTGNAALQLTYEANNPNLPGAISGDGHLWKSNTGTLEVRTANTYTGRTMISGGTLRMESIEIDEVTYSGSLPSTSVVELASGATFDLNGIDQTIGGLRGWRGLNQDLSETYGTVALNGASLTINAVQPTSFDLDLGSITGDGALVISGAETFTLVGDYVNPAGRTLRLQQGLLSVDGSLTVNDGTFELAGGQVVTDLLIAESDWNVTLHAMNVGQTLVDVVTFAFIDGAELNLSLGDGYSPAFGQSFTLLSAFEIDGASQGGSVFQYQDGETFFVSGIEFQIDWVTGSENIMLTVIPEPGIYAAAFGLFVLGLAHLRRRRT